MLVLANIYQSDRNLSDNQLNHTGVGYIHGFSIILLGIGLIRLLRNGEGLVLLLEPEREGRELNCTGRFLGQRDRSMFLKTRLFITPVTCRDVIIREPSISPAFPPRYILIYIHSSYSYSYILTLTQVFHT